MKILVINGSPKVQNSNTIKLTNEFIRGIKNKTECSVTTFNAYESGNLHDCIGCFTCWTKTPGKCIFSDDMPLNEYIEADIVIWSFPLYCFGMPSKAKCVMDRLLPTKKPTIMVDDSGRNLHPSRYEVSGKKYILISTCGFYEVENNFEGLIKQFDLVYGDTYTSILCPEGELFSVPQLEGRCKKYLEGVVLAGEEYAVNSEISRKTQNILCEKLFSRKVFIDMANASWDIKGDPNRLSKGHRILLQMAAIYNKHNYKKDIVLEFNFSDQDETYQLWIDRDKCVVVDNDFRDFTTKISTTLDVWLDISDGKISGPQAMMDGLYKVSGDFDTMMDMDKLFSTKTHTVSDSNKKKTNMSALLIPFITFWVGVPLSPFYGALATIVAAFLALLFTIKFRLTTYDYICACSAILLAIVSINGIDSNILVPISYIIFGIIWLVSCFLKIPLTAYYSVNEYGDEYLSNPLFVKTNRILTLCWSVAYFIVAIIVYYTLLTEFRAGTGIMTTVFFGLMGFYTKWFKDYYPAYVAKEK